MMPRNKESPTIAYTRWEPLEEDEEPKPGSGPVRLQFQELQEEACDNNSRLLSELQFHKHRRRYTIWFWSIRILAVVIIFGIGWICGFLVRWGIHKFHIDPMGHCEVPSSYGFDPITIERVKTKVSYSKIREFFEFFTSVEHPVGSNETSKFAHHISRQWKEFGLQKIQMEPMNVQGPSSSLSKSSLTVSDSNGTVKLNMTSPLHNILGLKYSPEGKVQGRLVYGHLGRFKDLSDLTMKQSHYFKDGIVLLRSSPYYNAGAMVRNAEYFGAKAVIFFPDPFYYKLHLNTTGGMNNIALELSSKIYPGDPGSPYLWDSGSGYIPKIPAISIGFTDAENLLKNYVNGSNLESYMQYHIEIGNITDNVSAIIEIEGTRVRPLTLVNVVGSLPGRYEPTRYVIVTAHHDTSTSGSSKAGIGHSVLMEVARVFGDMVKEGWRPGRSILFISWDGEEIGKIGSTEWLYQHSKELSARAVAIINLDYKVEDRNEPIAASPLFKQIIEFASGSVGCEDLAHEGKEEGCNLHQIWFKDQIPFTSQDRPTNRSELLFHPGYSVGQNVFGFSSIDVAVKLSESVMLAEPLEHINVTLTQAAKNFLEPHFRYSAMVAKFVIILMTKLVTSADVPLNAIDYSNLIHKDLHNFIQVNGAALKAQQITLTDAADAAKLLDLATERLHNTYANQSILLEFLAHHEFSDQIMELERSLISEEPGSSHPLLDSPYRHTLYGPSSMNPAEVKFLPRFTDALELASYYHDNSTWNLVRKEIFRVVNALQSATCVLDNHLVYTYD